MPKKRFFHHIYPNNRKRTKQTKALQACMTSLFYKDNCSLPVVVPGHNTVPSDMRPKVEVHPTTILLSLGKGKGKSVPTRHTGIKQKAHRLTHFYQVDDHFSYIYIYIIATATAKSIASAPNEGSKKEIFIPVM